MDTNKADQHGGDDGQDENSIGTKDMLYALAVASVAATVVTVTVVEITGADGQIREQIEESEEWCEERNGTLWRENSVRHGGLHCELPNGTSVHMSDVVEVSG